MTQQSHKKSVGPISTSVLHCGSDTQLSLLFEPEWLWQLTIHGWGWALKQNSPIPLQKLLQQCLLLTPVFSSEPQHQPDGEHLGPGSLPLLDEDAKQVWWGWEHQVLQGLIGRCNVQEPSVFFASKEALAEKGVSQVANNVTYGEKKKSSLLHWIDAVSRTSGVFRGRKKKSTLNSLCFLEQ